MGVDEMTLLKVDLNLPWSCAENGASIIDADGAPACYGLSIDETPLIVRAVNAHEALVSMIEALIGALRDEDDSFDVKYDARKLLASLE
jgi:hypothetical protein